MNRSRVDEMEAIDKLINTADIRLDFNTARAILEKNGWDFDRAAQSLMMSSEIFNLDGSLYDSRVEREFRQDQSDALKYGPSESSIDTSSGGPVVMTFGLSDKSAKMGPVIIQAVPTHTMNVDVVRLIGEDEKVSNAIRCTWHVESGLVVTDIVLYPRNAPVDCNPIAHKYADGQSSSEGTVRFDGIDRGLYDIRLFNRKNMSKPLIETKEPIAVGSIAQIDAICHDGNALRITVSKKVDGDSAELPVKSRDWIGLFHAEEKDNTVFIGYKYCSEIEDGSVEMRLPRESGKYQVRFFDCESPKGVCCGESAVIDYKPIDKLEALSYNTLTSILRVQWACFSREPSSWFWIGVFSNAKSGPKAKRETWNWCTKGNISKNGEHGMLDLELPKQLANTVYSRSSRGWELQDLELRFFVSSSEMLCSCPLPVMPQEPSANTISG